LKNYYGAVVIVIKRYLIIKNSGVREIKINKFSITLLKITLFRDYIFIYL
jgi:hypothetical protein